MSNNHFRGKSVPEHLIEARKKGAEASSELHGMESSGHKVAFLDSLKDTALIATLLFIVLSPLASFKLYLLLLLAGWAVWKACRSASFGWARLEKLHRVIDEERSEIQNHRQQEREELLEIYKTKGLEEPLLSQVIECLMADDNRLLQEMLTEELGLHLESYEHPLQQGIGALLGSLTVFIPSLLLPSPFLIPLYALLFLSAGIFSARLDKSSLITAFVHNLGILISCSGILYFLEKYLHG